MVGNFSSSQCSIVGLTAILAQAAEYAGLEKDIILASCTVSNPESDQKHITQSGYDVATKERQGIDEYSPLSVEQLKSDIQSWKRGRGGSPQRRDSARINKVVMAIAAKTYDTFGGKENSGMKELPFLEFIMRREQFDAPFQLYSKVTYLK